MSERSAHSPSVDVVVVGGGPAGAAAARLLARRGHSVELLTRPPSRGPRLAESVPPSCGKLFEAMGVGPAVERSGFLRGRGNTAWWGGEARSRSFEEGLGWQVERRALDALLLRSAEDAGAVVRTDATVRRIVVPAPGSREEGEGTAASVCFGRPGSPDRTVRGRFVLDCTGRTGVLARAEGARRGAGAPPTTALVGIWRTEQEGWGLSDESHTFVESYDSGWVWSIPVTPRTRYVTAMVDPRFVGGERRREIHDLYRGDLAKADRTRHLLEGATPVGRPWACGATPYDAGWYRGPAYLLVGDAAAFLDPLSSFGVKKALASGWLASVAVHTALIDPEREELAFGFFEARERAAVESFHAQTRSFYREAADVHDHPFWRDRSGHADSRAASAPGSGGPGRGGEVDGEPKQAAPFDDEAGEAARSPEAAGAPDVRTLRDDPRVLRAFHALRTAQAVELRPAPGVRFAEGAAVREGEVVREQWLETPSFPRGLRYLRDVDAVRLLELAVGRGVPEIHSAYAAAERPVPLPDFLGAVSVLLAEGALVNVAQGTADSAIPPARGPHPVQDTVEVG